MFSSSLSLSLTLTHLHTHTHTHTHTHHPAALDNGSEQAQAGTIIATQHTAMSNGDIDKASGHDAAAQGEEVVVAGGGDAKVNEAVEAQDASISSRKGFSDSLVCLEEMKCLEEMAAVEMATVNRQSLSTATSPPESPTSTRRNLLAASPSSQNSRARPTITEEAQPSDASYSLSASPLRQHSGHENSNESPSHRQLQKEHEPLQRQRQAGNENTLRELLGMHSRQMVFSDGGGRRTRDRGALGAHALHACVLPVRHGALDDTASPANSSFPTDWNLKRSLPDTVTAIHSPPNPPRRDSIDHSPQQDVHCENGEARAKESKVLSPVSSILKGEFRVEDEEQMVDSIETVYAIESVYGGEKAVETLAELAAQAHLVNALAGVMCKHSKQRVHMEPTRLLKTMRLLRDVCKVEPTNAVTVCNKTDNMKALLQLLRPAPQSSSPFDEDSTAEIRSLAAELIALCAIRPEQRCATRQVQNVIKSVKDMWWYGKGDKVLGHVSLGV